MKEDLLETAKRSMRRTPHIPCVVYRESKQLDGNILAWCEGRRLREK